MNWLNTQFPNWKPTLAGLGLAITLALQDAFVSGKLHKSTIGVVIFAAFMAWVNKGRQVTGGTQLNADAHPATPVGIGGTPK